MLDHVGRLRREDHRSRGDMSERNNCCISAHIQEEILLVQYGSSSCGRKFVDQKRKPEQTKTKMRVRQWNHIEPSGASEQSHQLHATVHDQRASHKQECCFWLDPNTSMPMTKAIHDSHLLPSVKELGKYIQKRDPPCRIHKDDERPNARHSGA